MAGKADIADYVASSVKGLTKKQAAEALDAVFESIENHLLDGDRVQVSGFGSFTTSERTARTGRNPATGETIQIPASTTARFKPAKALKEALNS